MKNTKHTEINDSSNQQDVASQSKRKILTSIGVTSGVLGASALSQNWVKPVVNSVVLPAHATTTPAVTTEPPTVTTEPPTVTTEPPTVTTEPPTVTTEPPAPAAAIEVTGLPASGVIDATDGNEEDPSVKVSLAAMPTEPVVVDIKVTATTGGNVTPDPASLIFTAANYKTAQAVKLKFTQPPKSRTDEYTIVVTFTASGGNYKSVTKAVAMTAGYYGQDKPGGPATGTVHDVTVAKALTLNWTAPKTLKEVAHYVVAVVKGSGPVDYDSIKQTVKVTGTTHTRTGLDDAADYSYGILAVYILGDKEMAAKESDRELKGTAKTKSAVATTG